MTTNTNPDPFPDGTDFPRLLVAAGPTHEPIDSVRYLGNRSSGRLGIDLADHAISIGWEVTLLLGPSCLVPASTAIHLERFTSARDLQSLLQKHSSECDVLVMAAAVADFTPTHPASDRKIRRNESQSLTLELSPTPDLLAGCCGNAKPNQLMVGFALEPLTELIESARNKLGRKNADLIVANPLETMESGEIQASIVASQPLAAYERHTEGKLTKAQFAEWLIPILKDAWHDKRNNSNEIDHK